MSGQSLISSDNYSHYSANTNSLTSSGSAFTESLGAGLIKCHGIITEVDHQELFYSKVHKLINTIIGGQAYQFGHQSSEYLVRVEEVNGGYMARSLDFLLYGNYMGRLVTGDEIEIIATDRNGKRVAKSIYNISTRSAIKPDLQLSAATIRILALMLVVLIICLISSFCTFIKSEQGAYAMVSALGLAAGFAWLKRWFRRKLFWRK